MLGMLGKNYSRQNFDIFFLFLPENRLTFHANHLLASIHQLNKLSLLIECFNAWHAQ